MIRVTIEVDNHVGNHINVETTDEYMTHVPLGADRVEKVVELAKAQAAVNARA